MTIRRSLIAATVLFAGTTSVFAQASVNSTTPLPRDGLGLDSSLTRNGDTLDSRGPASATESPTGPGTPGTTGTGSLGAGPTGTMASPGR